MNYDNILSDDGLKTYEVKLKKDSSFRLTLTKDPLFGEFMNNKRVELFNEINKRILE